MKEEVDIMKSVRSKKSTEYLHGFSKKEQDRLYRQARFLESPVFDGIDLSSCKRVLEVGCGVGAQTAILLERFPNITVTGIDISETQLKRAKDHLKESVKMGRAQLVRTSADQLPFQDNSFDAAFSTWFLEHVQNPVEILNEIRRVLKAGAFIYLHEVLNATLYMHPYSPATLKYWFEFNDHQWNLKGDPFVGAKLGNYLLASGFQNVSTEVVTFHFDNRSPKKRADFIEEWTSVLLSGAPNLLAAKKVTRKLVEEMKEELHLLKVAHDSVFFSSTVRARGQAF